MVYVVGLAGPAKVGKSTTSKNLVEELKKLNPSLSVNATAFADPIYQIASLITDIPVEYLKNQDYKESVWNETTAPVPGLIDWSPRKLLQVIGTEGFRTLIHPDIWLQLMYSKSKNLDIVIVEDARFPNEFKQCDYVIELIREGIIYAKNHPSAMPPEPEAINDVLYLYPDMIYTTMAERIYNKYKEKMGYNIFKEIKLKCNYCGNIIVSVSNDEWVSCLCEKTKVMGKTYKKVSGDNFTDLTILDLTNVPTHVGIPKK